MYCAAMRVCRAGIVGFFILVFIWVASETARPALAQAPSSAGAGREKLRRRAEYFTPRKFHNYFKGMDVISRPVQGGAAELWPDQLFDHVLKRGARSPRALVDVVETDSEIFGRNTWMLWCGGNEAFWDWLAMNSRGVSAARRRSKSTRRSSTARSGFAPSGLS